MTRFLQCLIVFPYKVMLLRDAVNNQSEVSLLDMFFQTGELEMYSRELKLNGVQLKQAPILFDDLIFCCNERENLLIPVYALQA